MAKATRVHSTPRRTASKNTTNAPHIKTADDALFKLHDNFCRAYSAMLQLEGGAYVNEKTANKEERALYRKWNNSVSVATDKARAVIAAPAHTLEGMLMKIHIAGFNFDLHKPGTFSAPYHGMACLTDKGRVVPQQWEPGGLLGSSTDEFALIVSIRGDLQRFAGGRI
jgi:hypothetical protein